MKVPISQIRSNPFQVRKHLDQERVQALADEIKALGYWGSLRARKKGNNQYELVFGHRRLEALKLLKVKDVDLEVVDLSDEDMATHALVENMQREGLGDLEKAAGLKRLLMLVDKQVVAKMVGLSRARIETLISLLDMPAASRKLIEQKEISGVVAKEAEYFGGEAMIETAAKHKLPLHTLRDMRQEIAAIPDLVIREKVKKAVITGKVRDAESVRAKARQVRVATSGKTPSDLHLVVRQWTGTITKWAKQLDDVFPYIDYMEKDTKGVAEFRTATREVIEKLKRFL